MNINQALESGKASLSAFKKYQCSWVSNGVEGSQVVIAKGFEQLIGHLAAKVGNLDDVTNLDIIQVDF